MKMEECQNDPKFRMAFVENDINNFNDIIQNITNFIYHNKSMISILEEIKKNIKLQDLEVNIIEKQLNELRKTNETSLEQKNELKILVGIYEKFLSFKNNKK
ncbi:MAG: hypothetical protein M0Q13_02745 [Methanothrix sp.]|jgi:archaellum component FlaC|nr:hypothetical protein [Methanothrix sp.]